MLVFANFGVMTQNTPPEEAPQAEQAAPDEDPLEKEYENPELESERIKASVQREFLRSKIPEVLGDAVKTIINQIAEHKRNGQREEHYRAKMNARILAKQMCTGNIIFLVAMTLSLAFLFGVIWTLRDNKETLLPVLSSVIGLLAGAGGGFVFGRASGGGGRLGR